jgi:hypothetical protein
MAKKIKVYAYEFGIELSDIIEEIFEKVGFYPVKAEKTRDKVTIMFEESLPESSKKALETHIKSKLPHFKFKQQKEAYIDNVETKEDG